MHREMLSQVNRAGLSRPSRAGPARARTKWTAHDAWSVASLLDRKPSAPRKRRKLATGD